MQLLSKQKKTMRYIIKGNDFSFTWTIKDCNGYVDLSAVTDLKVMYQHSTVPSKKYVADKST